MLGKKKYFLIIIIVLFVNYLLIYFSRHPPVEQAFKGVESIPMAVLDDATNVSISPNVGLHQDHGKGSTIFARELEVDDDRTIIPVLVMACNRLSIKRCLDSILKARRNDSRFPVYVSQDCSDQATENAIKEYSDVFYMKQPNQTDPNIPKKKIKLKGYFKISRHYRWALNQIFQRHHSACIVIEDDLEVSPDIFEYFLATLPILEDDPYLYCVSAWNDNGKEVLIDLSQPGLIHRTDFFPGLGWMLLKKHWLEFEPHWPDAFWDDWMRMPEIRKNRSCLRPEIPRTETFGKVGVSNGLHFTTHLQFIKKYKGFFPFRKANLSYLYVDEYEEHFLRRVYLSPEYDENYVDQFIKDGVAKRSFRVTYRTKDSFKKLAKKFGIMADFKSGIPRTAYRGIVPLTYRDHTVYVSPPYDWSGYKLTWV